MGLFGLEAKIENVRQTLVEQVNRLAPGVFRKTVPGLVERYFHKLGILLFASQAQLHFRRQVATILAVRFLDV